ncbi:MAG: hypothetical protein PVF63_07005 [Gammaproteobacteria bacterium]|jgi:hypothetical protein
MNRNRRDCQPGRRSTGICRRWPLICCLTGAVALAQAPPPSGFPGIAPEGPEERILTFTVQPERIDPGESATLRWEGINAFTLTIDGGIGAVATRGSTQISPNATTTYTLTVTGSGGEKTRSVTLEVAGTTAAAAASESPGQRELPRLVDGHIDLSGVYLGGRGVTLSSSIELVDGAEGFRVPQRDEDLGQGALCLPPGVPNATMMPYPLQIVHKPDVLVILYEAYNLFRIIPIGVDHPEYLDPSWMGNSVAYWEGDTLVVDVTAFNDKTRLSGHRHTQAMHVVERYTRSDYDTIRYTATVEDPNVFAEPLVYSGNLELHPEWEIGEYVCAENNKDYAELFTE